MIHMARRMGLFAKTVLLSATPSEQVRPILDALIAPNEITANATVYQETIDSRQVVHDVELKTLPCENADQLEVACKKILELKSELQRLQSENREANTKGEYIPCVVILNSVVKAIALEDQLVANGFPRDQLVPIRGLSSRKSRNLNSKQLVIGTSAIEVGIDFQTDYLLFEAGDASSFMQRFGRIGRHCPGIAFLLCDHQEAMSFASLNDSVSRHDFEMAVSAFYPEKDARAWFVFTSMGLLTICSQASNFEKQILSDRSADQSVRERISVWINDTVSDFATKLNVSNLLKPTIHKRTRKWFRDYCEINSFRTSLPSQTVWDVSEKNRGRECTYEVDVRTLLTRAIRIWWNNEHRRLYVSGYGKWKNVWFSKTFEDMPEVVGTLQTTSDTSVFPAEEMVFIQEGHITPVSHVMHTPANHIFIVVPLDVTNHLDWRIAWFRCGSNGSNAIAFDGDALLVKEINDRVTSRRISLT